MARFRGFPGARSFADIERSVLNRDRTSQDSSGGSPTHGTPPKTPPRLPTPPPQDPRRPRLSTERGIPSRGEEETPSSLQRLNASLLRPTGRDDVVPQDDAFSSGSGFLRDTQTPPDSKTSTSSFGGGRGFKGSLDNPNPLGQPGRPDYNPDQDGFPEVREEIDAAQAWLRDKRKELKDLPLQPSFDQFGREITGSGTLSPQAGLLQDEIDAMGGQINNILKEYLSFEQDKSFEDIERETGRLDEERKNKNTTELEGLRRQHALALQEVTDADARARLKARLDAELEAAKLAQENALDNIKAQGEETRRNQELLFNFENSKLDREFKFQEDLQGSQQRFTAEQNNLDRALEEADLREASRAARAIEQIRRDELSLEQEQFKFGVFSTLATSPEMLFFLGQTGALDFFGDILGDGGNIIRDLLTSINSSEGANIQQFSRLSGEEQGIERFRIAAQTGVSDVDQLLRGEAPRSAAGSATGEIAPGRGPTINLGR